MQRGCTSRSQCPWYHHLQLVLARQISASISLFVYGRGDPRGRPKAHKTERDMHKLHTFKCRLSRLYTWLQQAKQGKIKNLRRKCTIVAPYLSACGSTPGLNRVRKGKTPPKIWCKMPHSCTLSGRK